jgi:hypothetical protein
VFYLSKEEVLEQIRNLGPMRLVANPPFIDS